MTITATHIGTSTVQINNYWEPSSGAANLHSFDTFAAAIADAITGTANGIAGTLSGITFTSASGVTFQASTGWTLADSFWGYTNKTATRSYSPIYTQVFKCLCADGNSTKNLILRYNTVTQELLTTTCEKYEVATRTITNEAFTFYDCAPINYNLTYSDIVIMVHPRYLILHSYVAGEPTLWAGVVENAREDVYDVASSGYPDIANSTGYPCWGWISSVSWGFGAIASGGKVLAGSTTDTGPLWSMPRTSNGATGLAAAINYSCDLGVESYPSFLGSGNTLTGINRYVEANIRFSKTSWSVNKLLMPIKPIHNFNSTTSGLTNYGQIYGLKLLSTLGYNMNQVDIPVDNDLNANPTGVNRRHWLLNTHAKVPIAGCYKDMNTWTGDTFSFSGLKAIRHVSVGSAIYVLAGTTKGTGILYKINRFTRVVEALTFTNNSSLVDLVYDGERYLYITRNSTISSLIRLDIADNSISAVNGAVAYGLVTINGNTVTTCEYSTASTTYPMYRYVRQPFTGTVSALAAQSTNPSNSTGTAVASTTLLKLVTDFDGAILSYGGTATSIFKLPYDGAVGAASGISINGADATELLFLDGKTLLVIGCISSTTFNIKVANGYPAITTYTSIGSTPKPLSPLNRGYVGIFKYQGLIIMETADLNSSCIMLTLSKPLIAANMFDTTNALGSVTLSSRIFTPLTSVSDGMSLSARMYGSELMATSDAGLNIWQNLNGYSSIGSYISSPTTDKLAQVAIPA